MATSRVRARATFFPLEEYEERWTRVHATMHKRGFSTAVVWQRSGGSYDRAGDVYWLSNYASLASGQEPSLPEGEGRAFAALVLRAGLEPELHIAEPLSATDLEQIAVAEVYAHGNLVAGVADRLNALGVDGRVALVGDDTLPAKYYRLLTAATPAIEWEPADDLNWDAQRIKSPRERDLYRSAGEVASASLTATMQALIAGETGSEAAARGAALVTRAGGGIQRVAIHHGPKSEAIMWANGLYGHDTTAPASGEMVRSFIYGPLLHGQWLDPGRTAVCGNKPNSRQKRLIEATVDLVEGIMADVRAGVTPRQLGARGDQLVRESGYFDGDAAIWEIYGHGVGSFFQMPIIPANLPPGHDPGPEFAVDAPLDEHMAFTVEAFLTDKGVGTATFEQVFLITHDGIELLITTPMLFW